MLICSSLTELCSEYMYLQCTTINPIVNSLYSCGICCVPLFDRRPILEPRVLCSPSSAGSFSMKLNWMACQIPRADSLGKETLAGQHGHVCVLPFPWECPFVRICNLKANFFFGLDGLLLTWGRLAGVTDRWRTERLKDFGGREKLGLVIKCCTSLRKTYWCKVEGHCTPRASTCNFIQAVKTNGHKNSLQCVKTDVLGKSEMAGFETLFLCRHQDESKALIRLRLNIWKRKCEAHWITMNAVIVPYMWQELAVFRMEH